MANDCPLETGDVVLIAPDPGGNRPKVLSAVVVSVEHRCMYSGYDTDALGGGPWDGWLVLLRFVAGQTPGSRDEKGQNKNERWFGYEWLKHDRWSGSEWLRHDVAKADNI